jgi:hypothetical protein
MDYIKRQIEMLENVKSERDFVDFVRLMIDGLRNEPENWGDNRLLELYLGGIVSYLINTKSSRDAGSGRTHLSWKEIATMFSAATDYD